MIRERLQDRRILLGLVLGLVVVGAGLVLLFRTGGDASDTGEASAVAEEREGQAVAASADLSEQPQEEPDVATPLPAPTATASATLTPRPSPTSSPTATATQQPTLTPEPTRTQQQPVRAAGQSISQSTDQPTVQPTSQPTDTPTLVPVDCLDAVYLADVTIPDHSHLDKGEVFLKTWRVQNNGTCQWPENTQLAFASGSQLGAPDSVAVGALAPGETAEISVDMVAPEIDDAFQGTWRFVTPEGHFGTFLTVVIQVGEEPTPAPTATPNPEAPAPPPPPPSGGGHVGGGFELGGQTHTLAHPNEMHHAGMTWVKFQHKWSPGQHPNDVAGRIQSAHANGLKVLLSIPGGSEYPTSIDFAGYVEFLRGVAALGPDGIEVWNEQNIDREWPAGTIDPGAYVNNILAPAYNAIKSVNPNILVVSGAPAPTGFFGGCGGAGCDDAPYIAGMLAAGAAHYVDCIGVHYNEGILPPSQTSGDPRGSSSHYTRYFWGMVNTYWANFGGARPLCFTELGYVSPEGYGPLPAAFGWAANTTVAQQAAWLAEAAVLASNSGKVHLMIVYNVDFTHYDEHDPQAGYAIIRPGGGCPACETLHNVTH